MEILGVGPLELVFILIIALIVLGPQDMVKAGRTIGRFLRKLVTSPSWRVVQQTSRDLRYLPNKLIREAGLEEIEKDLEKDLKETKQIGQDLGLEQWKKDVENAQHDLSDWTTPPATIDSPPPPEAPPSEAPGEANPNQETEKS